MNKKTRKGQKLIVLKKLEPLYGLVDSSITTIRDKDVIVDKEE